MLFTLSLLYITNLKIQILYKYKYKYKIANTK